MATIRSTKAYEYFVNMLNNRADAYITAKYDDQKEALLREIFAKCTIEIHFAAAVTVVSDYLGWGLYAYAANGIASKAVSYRKPGDFCKSGKMSDAQVRVVVECAARDGDIFLLAKKLGIEFTTDAAGNRTIVCEE